MIAPSAAPSRFGFVVNAILSENHTHILSKFRRYRSKLEVEMLRDKARRTQRLRERKMEEESLERVHVVPPLARLEKREQEMRETATLGVVTLFGAIADHQRRFKQELMAIDEDKDVLQLHAMKMEQEMSMRFESKLAKSSGNAAGTPLIKLRRNGRASAARSPPPKRRKLSAPSVEREDVALPEDRKSTATLRLPRHLQNVVAADSGPLRSSRADDDDDEDFDGDLGQKQLPRKEERAPTEGDAERTPRNVLGGDVLDDDDAATDTAEDIEEDTEEDFAAALSGDDDDWVDEFGSEQSDGPAD